MNMNTHFIPSSVLGLGPDDLGKVLRVTLASGVDMVGTLTQLDALRFPVDGMLTITIGPLDVHVMASQVACWSFVRDKIDAPLTVDSIVSKTPATQAVAPRRCGMPGCLECDPAMEVNA